MQKKTNSNLRQDVFAAETAGAVTAADRYPTHSPILTSFISYNRFDGLGQVAEAFSAENAG